MDVVVTVPKSEWKNWIAEGDLPGDPWSGIEYHFYLGGVHPRISIGERVYIVAHGKLRGYAPLVRVWRSSYGRFALIRCGGAVAVTIVTPLPGFRGFRYRFWDRAEEVPFPDWRTP